MKNQEVQKPWGGSKAEKKQTHALRAWAQTGLLLNKTEKRKLGFWGFFFIHFWPFWVFTASRAFLYLWWVGGYSSCRVRASHCCSFSCCGAQAAGQAGFSSFGSQVSEHRLSSCGTRAYLPRSMWGLPRSGIKPVYPTLAGGFLTTGPWGKPEKLLLN